MNISDALIGGLIGSVLGLISTYVMEWVKSRRDWKTKERTRELELKRDAYRPLVNAFTEGMTLFTLIPQTHYSKLADLKLSSEAQNAIGGSGLIASAPVIGAVNTASKQLAQGCFRLMSAKVDEAKLAMELDSIDARIKQINDANRLVVDQMRALQEGGKLTAETSKTMGAEFEQNQAEFRTLSADQHLKFEQRNEILKALQLQVMREIAELSAKSARAVIEIRRDLEIPTDEEALLSHFKDSVSFINESFPGFVDEIWAKATIKGAD